MVYFLPTSTAQLLFPDETQAAVKQLKADTIQFQKSPRFLEAKTEKDHKMAEKAWTVERLDRLHIETRWPILGAFGTPSWVDRHLNIRKKTNRSHSTPVVVQLPDASQWVAFSYEFLESKQQWSQLAALVRSEAKNRHPYLFSGGYAKFFGEGSYSAFRTVVGNRLDCSLLVSFDYPADQWQNYRHFNFGGLIDQQCFESALSTATMGGSFPVVAYGTCKGALTMLRSLSAIASRVDGEWVNKACLAVVAASPPLDMAMAVPNMDRKGPFVYWFACRAGPSFSHHAIPPIASEDRFFPLTMPLLLTGLPKDPISDPQTIEFLGALNREQRRALLKLKLSEKEGTSIKEWISEREIDGKEGRKAWNEWTDWPIETWVSARTDLRHGYLGNDPCHTTQISKFLQTHVLS